MATPIRSGDKIIVEGEIIQEFKGKEPLVYIKMNAKHVIYCMKCGCKLK